MLTDLISSIGLGTGTGFKHDDAKRDKELVYILQKALDFGINFIDTAEAYFDGHAEELVGRAFKKIREKVFIATKFSPEHARYTDVLQAAHASLRRLQTDYIDLYQIHWPNPAVPLEETLGALATLTKSGNVRSIGVCNFSLRKLKEIREVSKLPIVSLQTEYNLRERSIEQAVLPYCESHNITLIAYTPLNSGAITRSQLVHDLSKKYGRTPSQILLNFLISHPAVVAIPGTTNLAHVEENAKAREFRLSQGDIAIIEKTFVAHVNYLDTQKIKVRPVAHGHFPSPDSLADDIRKGDFLKPVKVHKLAKPEGNFAYELSDGRIRYWAWVIAFGGQKPIPSLIEDSLWQNKIS